MELRQLEYFVAVAEEASFTRAAQRVHISQSGVSAQVRRLERELGAELVDRSRRAARLTAAGAAALPHARAAVVAARAARRAVDDVSGLVRGRLEVGMVTGGTLTPFFDALAAFRRAHAGVELVLAEDASDRLVERVRAGTLDVALAGLADARAEDLEALTVLSERVVAAVPPDHPLAGRERVTLAELAEHSLACIPRGAGIRTAFERACAARDVRPAVALEASAPAAVADLALRGLGVAILSESIVAARADRLVALALDEVEERASLALVRGPGASPAARALVERARAAFAAAEPAVG